MYYTRDQFISAVNNCTPHTVDFIDQKLGCCRYVWHWTTNMDRGHWNPLLNEMDFELRGIKTPGELYDFIVKRNDPPNKTI